MHVLHLLPGPDERRARVSGVVRAQRELGLSIETWEAPELSVDSRIVALATFLPTAPAVELVHNHLGPWAVALLARLERPAVTTLYAAPSAFERTFLCGTRGTGDPSALVADLDEDCGLEVAAHVADLDAGAAAARYAELYGELTLHWRRKAAETRHDVRPWGQYWVLDDQPDFKVKRITVEPGKRLSYQRHQRRCEHWLFVAGTAKVTLDGVDHVLGSGDDIRIPLGAAHRVENVGAEPATFIELQSGTYFGEDDIERLADDYGRTS